MLSRDSSGSKPMLREPLTLVVLIPTHFPLPYVYIRIRVFLFSNAESEGQITPLLVFHMPRVVDNQQQPTNSSALFIHNVVKPVLRTVAISARWVGRSPSSRSRNVLITVSAIRVREHANASVYASIKAACTA